ncbi:MAG: hypothetical protein AAB488_02070 [Patescibacteria group bacterium]
MKNPEVLLKIDKKADIKNALLFIKYNPKDNLRFIRWFLPKKLHHILDKRYSQKERNKIIKKYTNDIFSKREEEIKEATIKSQADWKLVKKRYFNLINKIFKKHPWPKGKYTGFTSVFCMYPRDIKEKTFSFPFFHATPRFSNIVIAHELLHFIFFDYIKNKYGLQENSKINSKKNNYVWQISEVFNSVIENWEPYYKIFKIKTLKQKPYTGREYFLQMKKQWEKKQDIDYLLDQWFIK